MNIIELEETASTNSYLASIADESPHGTVVTATTQTAGRGQRGNTWESMPGKNITMSMLLRPSGVHPSKQFFISQAVSVAIVKVLSHYLPGETVSVKWPNDIYVGNRKICGILIENVITSSAIVRSIVGIGLNVNQREFFSDAPNPVSIVMLTGVEKDLQKLISEIAGEILSEVDGIGGNETELQRRYFDMLWRKEGYWPYRDNVSGEFISARVESVAPDGILTLSLASGDGGGVGEQRSYAFKEVSAIV